MTQRMLIWLAVAIAIGVGIYGIALVVQRDPVTAPAVAATPALPPTATKPASHTAVPTRTAQNDCQVDTTQWVIAMNQILMRMIDTDDTNPAATGQALRTAQMRFDELVMPACADEQLRAIDASIRASVPLYIAWTDALIAGDTDRAQQYEDQGDAAFQLTPYFAYLDANGYASYRQQLLADISRVATTQAGASTPSPQVATTTPVLPGDAGDAAYQACVSAIDTFTAQVEPLYQTAQTHVDTLEAYVQRAPLSGVDPVQIDTLFASLETIDAPLCIDEPLEMIDRLRLMRDTLRPGFVELKVELAYGNPDAASYARVQGWIDELQRFESDLNARFTSMPQSLLALKNRAPTPTPRPYPTAVPSATRATAAQSSLAPACRTAVDRFLADVDVYVNRAVAIHFDITEYMQGRPRPMKYQVKDAFAGVASITVPACTTEPGQIMTLFTQIEYNEFNAHLAIVVLDASNADLAPYVTPLDSDIAKLQALLADLRTK